MQSRSIKTKVLNGVRKLRRDCHKLRPNFYEMGVEPYYSPLPAQTRVKLEFLDWKISNCMHDMEDYKIEKI